ncbi:hypothetical protein RJT34_13065 [Clitoria ternatea]|uniref:Uncharacterized protein n=1 Tax=Clitoria ternatea TaxID=43366 RepID=A0AAN9JNC0_CLITE
MQRTKPSDPAKLEEIDLNCGFKFWMENVEEVNPIPDEINVQSSDSIVWKSISSFWSELAQCECWSIGARDEALFGKHELVNPSLKLEEVASNIPAEI